MKKIFEDLAESIRLAFDRIEQENDKFINLINQNSDLAQSSYTDLEQLTTLLEGNVLENWGVEKQSSLLKL